MNHQKDTTTKLSRFDVMFTAFALSMMVLSPILMWHLSPSGDSMMLKTGRYSAPINYSKQGDPVDINNTRPYTAMQLNLNPLMAAFA